MHKYNSSTAKIRPYIDLFVNKYSSEQLLMFADKLLGGELTVGLSTLGSIRYNPHCLDRFNWETVTLKNSNTFSLYLFGLRHLFILARAYSITPNVFYLELADDFLLSFHRYISRDKGVHAMVFNDHAMAERIENLVYLFNIAEEANYHLKSRNILIAIVEDCVTKLLGEQYYQRNHNHGISADKAALIGICFLNRPDMNKDLEFIVSRLTGQVENGYFHDGVHKENSIDYHITVTASLWSCLSILKYMGHEYHKTLYKNLQKANEYIVYAFKPNRTAPLFGDSKGVSDLPGKGDGEYNRISDLVEIFDNDKYLRYIESAGKQGDKPSRLSVLFPSGYVFFREHFNPENYENATWMALKSGYATRVHKHQDDLSICLYSKGFDIFVDSGMFNFMPKDKIKDYMESVPAHSTVGIKGVGYSIASGNGEKFKIQRFERGKSFDYAMASAKIYEGTSIYRHVFYLRQNDIIIIRDEIFSEKEQNYAQYFNLSNSVSPICMGKTYSELSIGDTPYCVTIRQMGGVDSLTLLEGEKTSPPSLLSTGFGCYESAKTLEYVKKGKNCEFVTVIEIIAKDSPERDIMLLPDSLVIGPENIAVNFEKTNPVKFNCAEISIEKNTVTVKNNGAEEGLRFSLYVFIKDGIVKLPYTQDKTIQYEHFGDTNFVLMYFVANQTGELVKGILGEFNATSAGIKVKKLYTELHYPVIKKLQTEKLETRKYRFSAHVDYDYKALCSWWVYYNGGGIYYEKNNNYSFEYAFTEPGEYVIMLSIRDKYFGEFAFYQFDKISVD